GHVTTEEKVQKKNDVKVKSMLLMALPNEHIMTFNQYKDAKTLFVAIQTRFGGNEATKKTQKTLLKQMYENFSAPSTESLDSIFNRLQKIISQLAILGKNISQEDINLKFLRSMPSEWNTHVVVWRNKPDLDTMSFDDLYNNFKIVEQEVKGTASSSSSSQNMAFVSSPSSTNKVNTANTQVCPASTQVSTANLSDDTVYAFLASQPNGSQLVYEDLEQIHEDDREEMDLKWQLALLSMRTRRFFQKTSRKITLNGSDTFGYDTSKVECFNCHKMGHFVSECRGPRNQDNRNRNQDSSRRTVNVEETSSKVMVAINGAGFDWSYMTDDEVPRNMDLMAFSDSEVHNDKTCLKSFEILKTQLDDLRIEFNKSDFNLATYKRGLTSVEEQLVFYKKNELEKLKQEKESNQLKIENFDNASKSLDKLIGSQITDKSRKGVGFVSYNVVPPPHTRLFSPLNLDLSYSGLEEFQQPEFEGYGPKSSKSVSEDISNEVRESPDAPLIEELVSDDKLEKKTVFPTVAKIEFVRPKQQEKPVRKPVKYAEMYKSQSPRGNQRNWNNQKSQQLGSNFMIIKLVLSVEVLTMCRLTAITIKGKGWNMVPRAVLMKTGLRSLNTARPVNTAHPKTTVYSARPMSHFSKSAQSTVKRPYQIRTSLTNKNSSQKVNTAKGKFYTARPKAVNTARPNSAVVNAVRANQVNAIKASACWVWRPTKLNSASITLKRHNYVDARGRSKVVYKKKIKAINSGCSGHMTGNMSYLSNFKEFDGGYMCDKKNSVLFTDTGCFVLSPDFKLTDESQNRVLVVKPHNKTPYELFRGRTPALSFMRPFGCHVTILNTLDYLGKFDGKSNEGFFVGYSMNSKAFRVYNIRTRKVEENLHIRFLEDKPIIAGDGPKWLFDIDVLTKSMNYVPVVAGTNSNDFAGTEESIGAGHSSKETGSSQDYILMPLWKDGSLFDSSSKNASNDEPQPSSDAGKKDDEGVNKESGIDDQERPENSTQDVNAVGPSINTASTNVNTGSLNINTVSPTVTTAPLEATHADFFGDETEIDMSNITATYLVPSTPNTRIHKDNSLNHVIGDVQSCNTPKIGS
ncbi:ribonuclease H-like domain-containing protein, partial [Tanacetum coccineum]